MATYSPADYVLLRLGCATLKEQNWPQVKIAQALGMIESWVSKTLYHQYGSNVLIWKKPARSACRLDKQQLAQLVTELTKDATAYGFDEKPGSATALIPSFLGYLALAMTYPK